jgi:hypothetical protein
MAITTKLRLQQMTGSYGSVAGKDIRDTLTNAATNTYGSLDGEELMSHVASAIKRINGAATWTDGVDGTIAHATTTFTGDIKVSGGDLKNSNDASVLQWSTDINNPTVDIGKGSGNVKIASNKLVDSGGNAAIEFDGGGAKVTIANALQVQGDAIKGSDNSDYVNFLATQNRVVIPKTNFGGGQVAGYNGAANPLNIMSEESKGNAKAFGQLSITAVSRGNATDGEIISVPVDGSAGNDIDFVQGSHAVATITLTYASVVEDGTNTQFNVKFNDESKNFPCATSGTDAWLKGADLAAAATNLAAAIQGTSVALSATSALGVVTIEAFSPFAAVVGSGREDDVTEVNTSAGAIVKWGVGALEDGGKYSEMTDAASMAVDIASLINQHASFTANAAGSNPAEVTIVQAAVGIAANGEAITGNAIGDGIDSQTSFAEGIANADGLYGGNINFKVSSNTDSATGNNNAQTRFEIGYNNSTLNNTLRLAGGKLERGDDKSGGTDTPGENVTLSMMAGTGTGTPGRLIVQAAKKEGGSSSTTQTRANVMVIDDDAVRIGPQLMGFSGTDLKIRSQNDKMYLRDKNADDAGADWNDASGVLLSGNSNTWKDFEDTFGTDVSLMNAVILASTGAPAGVAKYANTGFSTSNNTIGYGQARAQFDVVAFGSVADDMTITLKYKGNGDQVPAQNQSHVFTADTTDTRMQCKITVSDFSLIAVDETLVIKLPPGLGQSGIQTFTMTCKATQDTGSKQFKAETDNATTAANIKLIIDANSSDFGACAIASAALTVTAFSGGIIRPGMDNTAAGGGFTFEQWGVGGSLNNGGKWYTAGSNGEAATQLATLIGDFIPNAYFKLQVVANGDIVTNDKVNLTYDGGNVDFPFNANNTPPNWAKGTDDTDAQRAVTATNIAAAVNANAFFTAYSDGDVVICSQVDDDSVSPWTGNAVVTTTNATEVWSQPGTAGGTATTAFKGGSNQVFRNDKSNGSMVVAQMKYGQAFTNGGSGNGGVISNAAGFTAGQWPFDFAGGGDQNQVEGNNVANKINLSLIPDAEVQKRTDVYLNGQLLLSGAQGASAGNGNGEYAISPTADYILYGSSTTQQSIQFGFRLEEDDTVVVAVR